MKLWVKTLTGLGAIGTIAGATVGGMYAYSKLSPSVQGHAHAASLPLENDLNPMSSSKDERDAFAKLDLHFINQGDNPTTSIAKYIPNFDDSTKDIVEYNGKTMGYTEFLETYILETGNQPTLVTYAGTALFQNQYLTAVTANDFARYVAWFMINVSWGPDMTSLDSFTIVRGIEKVGSAIMLGGHASIKKEATNIKFYPDGFFGSLPMYSNEAGAGNGPDSLMFKANVAPLTWSGVQRLIKANKESNDAFQGKSKLRYIEDIGLLPGSTEHGYVVYCDAYTGLIDALLGDKVIGKMTTKHNLTGPYIDENGDAKIGVHDGIDLNTRVSYLDVLNVSQSGFHGVGYNFLKYVGAHEYGHHQTLQTASDISESGVLSGAYSTRTGISASSMYDKSIMNLYFSARASQLRLTGESAETEDKDSPRDQIPKFWERHNEEQGDPFGTDAAKGDGRAAMTWDEIVAEAKRRDISLWAMFLENSFDTKSGSLNPATNPEITWFYDKGNKEFVNSLEGIGNKGIVRTYSAPKSDGTVDEVPVEFSFDKENSVFIPKVKDDKGEWIIHNEDGSNIYPGKPSETPAGGTETYEYQAVVKIASFVMQFPYLYSINGWNISKDGSNPKDVLTKQALIGSQIFEDYASIFSDYTNNFPEVLTRDNLQTVYMPSTEELDYTPDYLTGISEASTGLEYYIDKSLSSKWLGDAKSARSQFPLTSIKLFDDYRSDFKELLKDVPDAPNKDDKVVDQTTPEWQEYFGAAMKALSSIEGTSLLSDFQTMIDNFAGSIQQPVYSYILNQIKTDPRGESVMGPVFAMILAQKYKYPSESDPDVAMNVIDVVKELLRKNTVGTEYNWISGVERTDASGTSAIGGINHLLADVSQTSFVQNYFLAPNYIGVTQKSQNGWLKDRTMKLTLGSNLYMEDGSIRPINVDNQGNPIDPSDPNYWNPDDIIKELDGKTPAKTYAEAQWLYTLRTKGVGSRTITGLWRSKERDAVYMWGYIPTQDEKGAAIISPKFLQFTDKVSGEKIYLPVTTDVDNLHYYKTQKEGADWVTLKDMHYTSWMSDFASMGAYRNALLKGDHDYTIEFTDGDKKVIPHLFTMGPTGQTGSRTVIAENGKTPSQAATVLTTDVNGVVTITVKKQFNI